jgi:hypothetical protein
MFFLHAPSAAGLSPPVDGMAGVVPLVPMGANAGPLLDARLLATRVTRPVGSPVVDAESGTIALADAEIVVTSWQQSTVLEPATYPLPVGVRPLPVMPGASPRVGQTKMHSRLNLQEQSDVAF